MRVSDTERQRAIDELRRHCAAGRLDVDEYAGRVEQVLTAATLEELDRVLVDLPMMRIADPADSRANGRDSLGRGSTDDAADPGAIGPSATLAGRMGGSLLIILSVVIVVGAVLLAVVASWTWVAVLLAGWAIGLLQARLAQRRR
jgi:hypothetical protein